MAQLQWRLLGIGSGFLLIVVAVAVARSWGPVSRAQLTRFARRQRLRITPGNGEPVIRYLARTRLWRASGAVAGALAYMIATFGEGRVGISSAWLFGGWFAGALGAEMVMATRPRGPRRVASLVPRSYHRYVGAWTWRLPPAAMAASLAVGTVAIAKGGLLGHVEPVLLAAGVTVAVLLVRRRVVARAQQHLPPDALAADEAIRSRSLHVLCGGGAAIVLLCIGQQLYGLYGLVDPSGPWADPLAVLAQLDTLGAVLTGWLIGTARWAVRPPGDAGEAGPPSPVTPPAATAV